MEQIMSIFGGGKGGGDKEFGSSQAYAYVINQRGKNAGDLAEWVPFAILAGAVLLVLVLVGMVARK